MNTVTAVENFSLTMKRDFKYSKQDVYEAWTTRDALISWFAPTKGFTTAVHELDLTIGGHYRIEMIEPDGTIHAIHGAYVALDPFDQIAFTWKWASDEQNVNSLVTIDFKEKNGITEMTLVHDRLASQESVDLHAEGWMGCLTQLEAFFK